MFYKESVPIAIGMKTKMSESVALSFSLRTLRSIFSANFAVKNREEKKIKKTFSAVFRNFMTFYDISFQEYTLCHFVMFVKKKK